MRVHELAKELGVPSPDLVKQLTKLDSSIKGPMSVIDEAMVGRLRQAMVRVKAASPKKLVVPQKAPAKSVKLAPPRATAVAKTLKKPAVVEKKVAGPPSRDTSSAAGTVPPRSAAAPVKKPAITPTTKAPAVAPKPVTKTPTPIVPAARPAASAKPTATAPPIAAKSLSAPKPAAPAAPARPAPKVTTAPPTKPAAPAPAVTAKSPKPATVEPVVEAPAPEVAAAPKPLQPLQLSYPISVKDLALKLDVKASDIIKNLMTRRIFAGLNQSLDYAQAAEVSKAFGYDLLPEPTLEERLIKELAPDPKKLVSRAPVVTFMGHVDHGKTSLLDAIRQSKVAEKEAGGITQHIGAYEVVLEKGHVTFLDTPGHEAFTALRARGANVTDIVVLVVAADDGVMPQTLEAMDHAKAADVPIIVAINKIDKPEANPQQIKQQLAGRGLMSEDWGGKTIMVSVSAKTGQGIDELLEMLLLEAELLELKADPTTPALGVVIEAQLSKERGPIATLLIQQGTLHVGDFVIVGALAGKVRALTNDRGHRVKEVRPGSPVEVLGLPGVPKAGDRFMVLTDEKVARQLLEQRQDEQAKRSIIPPKRVTLEDLHQRIAEGALKELRLIVKADVQGSLEAISHSLAKIDTQGVQLNLIHAGVGDISESDVMLAAASDGIVIGFHVGVDPMVQVDAINEGVDIRIYQIIYELVNAIKAAIEGLLEPTTEETFLGRAQIKRLFQISKIGMVAGCLVTKGTIRRDAVIRVIRGKDRLTETKISNLKRVKDDVREVQEGVECGISLEGNLDLQPGDLIEAWELKKVARKLA